MKLNQKGFGVIEGLLLVIALTLIVGVGFYVVNANRETASVPEQAKATPTESKSVKPEPSKQYLEFKRLGVKIELNEQTKDAYTGATAQDDVYISSRYFDDKPGFEECRVNGQATGIIALTSGKPGDDRFGSPLTEKDFANFDAVKIDDTYYWLESANSPCWDPDQIPQSDPRVQKHGEFRAAISAQQQTITKL